jgi:hydroxylamine reductase (hybrid-cluster protein)
MIVFLFNCYFNPLTITTLEQNGHDVIIWFNNDARITIKKAHTYDVAATINSAIEDFHKGRPCN